MLAAQLSRVLIMHYLLLRIVATTSLECSNRDRLRSFLLIGCFFINSILVFSLLDSSPLRESIFIRCIMVTPFMLILYLLNKHNNYYVLVKPLATVLLFIIASPYTLEEARVFSVITVLSLLILWVLLLLNNYSFDAYIYYRLQRIHLDIDGYLKPLFKNKIFTNAIIIDYRFKVLQHLKKSKGMFSPFILEQDEKKVVEAYYRSMTNICQNNYYLMMHYNALVDSKNIQTQTFIKNTNLLELMIQTLAIQGNFMVLKSVEFRRRASILGERLNEQFLVLNKQELSEFLRFYEVLILCDVNLVMLTKLEARLRLLKVS